MTRYLDRDYEALAPAFRIVGVEHVAGLRECLVESEGCAECMRCVGALCGELEVIPHELLVHRMNAVLDDCLGALTRILAAKVGDTLLCSENLD